MKNSAASSKKTDARKVRLDLECTVCFGPHDRQVHAATLRVRRWFRERVMRHFVRPRRRRSQ